uniref:Serine aminopeptidase S33 domain-containing protein n=1 Tax=Kalanchoe fedtschenkoi TaxID=63787 RepID=A0A7N0V6K8_KALFE
MELTAVHIAKSGFATCAIDHQGHGLSEGLSAHIPHINPIVDDCASYFDSFRARHDPDLPAFLYAESLGGAIALLLTLRKGQKQWDGAVLNGAMCGISSKFKPPWPLEHLLFIVALTVPTWHVVPTRGTLLDVSVKEEWKRRLVMNNPRWRLTKPRAATARELLRVCSELQGRFEEVNVPLLMVHGGDDRMCDVACVEELHRRAASGDKTLKVYPGMWHVMLGEKQDDVDKVFGDVVEWLRTRAMPARHDDVVPN